MKLKSFNHYLEKRLDKAEIAELEQLAKMEFEAIRSLRQDIAIAVNKYVNREGIGFNELVRRLGVSTAQAVKIQKGEANLTLGSLAHIAALLKKKPHIVFK